MIKINEQDTKPSARYLKPDLPKGDFAAGERTVPAVPTVGDFASGEHELPVSTAVGDFASGEHELPIPTAVGDFASGEHELPTTPENVVVVFPVPPASSALDHKE